MLLVAIALTGSGAAAQTFNLPEATARPATTGPYTCATIAVRALRTVGERYVFTLTSGVDQAFPVHLEFSTATSVYAVDVPKIPFDRALGEAGISGFRTAALALEKPSPDPLIEATAKATNERGVPCPVSTSVLRYWDDRGRPHDPELTKPFQSLADQLKSEAAGATPLTAAFARKDEALSCARPFVEARIKDRVQPTWSTKASLERQRGLTSLVVVLDDTGKIAELRMAQSSGFASLDNATAAAARASTYVGEIYRCKPKASQVYFNVQFTDL